ncbi:arylsulfatase B [Blastopirellula marina]|uniref:Arylsulfatase B n=1 Tax=Blastopirellula marina DSM 3645 TaxID=314230 RepID=A3ZMN6_9BACT|nr:arylsulfatase [Blastopirellula marina]EAQ82209.1 arylsulfatase B precursor [Blastopirellula marina DSM 3645]
MPAIRSLILTIALTLASVATTFATDAPRPNIVFLLADDLGGADVSWRGSPIKTPQLDALANSGAKLEQFYVQPVCSPTRSALLTGRYPMRYGLQVGVVRPWADYGLPLDERTLAEALQDAGYETAIVGKWHLGHVSPAYLPMARGFDHQYGHYNGALDYFTHDRDGGHDWHKDDHVNRDEGYATHLIAQEAVRVIQDRDKKKPLFLYVPFNAVHSPLQVPESYAAPYGDMKKRRQAYAGMVAALDEAVGQIVDEIQRQEMLDNTLFIFSSDNGGPEPGKLTDNGPLRGGKHTLYEGGVRVCAFASWKGRIAPGSKVEAPLHIVDWYPTLIELAGGSLQQAKPLDGRNIWPSITTGEPSPHDVIVCNITPTEGAIRVGDWKLVVHNIGKPREKVELFNLSDDLAEQQNRATTNAKMLRKLRNRFDQLASEAAPAKNAGPQPKDYQAPAIWGERAHP